MQTSLVIAYVMGSFHSTERRLKYTCERYPIFPCEAAVLVRLVKHLYKRLHNNANVLFRPYGINHPEYDILMMMYGTPNYSITPTEAAEAAGEKPANVTRLTEHLCKKGLIRRSGNIEDRRKVVLTLEPSGLELVERMLPNICDFLGIEVSGLTEVEQLQLQKLLKKMLKGVKELG
jgi:MarR family transcriptional repressor of emrRAB